MSDRNLKSPNLAIGVFDSGVGGLTVVRALRKELPCEDIVYLGDLARLPYGDKSAETVRRYSMDNLEFLTRQNVKLVVVACHTATAWALELLQMHSPVPVIGVIQPAVEATRQVARKGVAVIATRGTISSGVFQNQLSPHIPVQAIACPLFVPLVEEGLTHHPATQAMVRHYLSHLTDIDTILLGCTHYPLLAPVIAQELGPRVQLIDPAITCAHAVAGQLQQLQLARSGHIGSVQFHATDKPPHLDRLIETFLGEAVISR